MKSKHDVRVQQSRRRFLADTALGAAGLGLGAAGMESAQARTKWEKMIKGLQTVTTDVLIVGSGAAGTAAAIEARRSGASVLVIEKMGSLGGSSIISRGALAVPSSPMQRAMGIDDSPEHFADDLMSSAYCGHPGRIECLALEALPTFEWLTNEIGVRWVMDAVGSEIEQSVPRSAIVAGDGAAALMMPLLDRARTLDAEFEVNEKLLHLITRETYDGVAVTGAVVENTRTGLRRCINVRRGVVLAAGGFAADAPFRQRYNQRLSEHVGTATQPGSTSEVLREAARIGAWLVHLQYITCIPDANPVEKGWGTSWQFSRWCAGAQGLWVERQTGRRFVNEMSSTAERTNGVFDVLNADRDVVAIADARAVRHPGSMVFTASDVELLVSRGFVQKFETLALLAQACGIPFSNLKVEVELYNRAVTAAREGRTAGSFTDRLGRPIAPEAELMEEGPWYCAPLLAKVLMCSGGLAIDLKSRVLSVVDDRPIPGLFAAGEITGGLNGKGDAGACGLMDAIVFGRIAGREAARIPKDYSDWREMNPLVFHHRAYVGDRQDRPLAVVFDPKGRLQFSESGLPTGEHVVAVLDPKIDEAHLARLRRAGVSYVFQGDGAECTEREKLSAALAALEETFGVKRLLLEGGGVLNGSFLAAGLIKEISVLVCPTVDGRSESAKLFSWAGSEELSPAEGVRLKLLEAEPLANGVVWLHYLNTLA